MKVTIKHNQPISDFRAIERTETFFAVDSFESGNLVYFRVDRFNYKTVSKSEIVRVDYE